MWKQIWLGVGILLTLTIIAYQLSFLASNGRKEAPEHSDLLVAEQGDMEREETVSAGQGSDKVTRATNIIIESYDRNGRLVERQEETPGAELIGNNRLDMLIYANGYRDQAPEEEQKDGLERMVLASFSPESVTLIKYYGEPEIEQGYFIGLKDNAVIVYSSDRTQVYEYTNIELWTLPEQVQSDLVEGIYVKDERELFDFLQTYSS